MKRTASLVLLLLTGCSTAPVADLLDWCKPGRMPPGPTYGGVCGGNCAQCGPPVTSFFEGTPVVEKTPAEKPPAPVADGTPATLSPEVTTVARDEVRPESPVTEPNTRPTVIPAAVAEPLAPAVSKWRRQ